MADYKSFDDYFHYSLDKTFGERNPEPPESIDVGGSVGRLEIRPPEETKGDFGTIVKSGYATAKGAVQGELGILGELEHLWNGITAIYNTPDGKSKVDSFLSGLSKESQLPDTERIKAILNKVIPEVNKDYTIAETIGEVAAPGALLTGMAAKGAKAIKGTKSTLSSMMDSKPINTESNFNLSQQKRLVEKENIPFLYRQMGTLELKNLLDGKYLGNGSDSMNFRDMYFATDKKFAIGQGQNKNGVIVTYNSFDTLSPKTKKPADNFVEKQLGAPSEVVLEDVKDATNIKNSIHSIEFPKGSLDLINKSDATSPYNIIGLLELKGWKKTIGNDGKILIINPLSKQKANK